MSECGLYALSSVLKWNKNVVLALSNNEIVQNASSILKSTSTSSLISFVSFIFSIFFRDFIV
jgi:hypothetical protein